MLLDFGYLPKFVMLYFVFDFYLKKQKIIELKKASPNPPRKFTVWVKDTILKNSRLLTSDMRITF